MRLIEEEGYGLMTFPMKFSEKSGRVRMEEFTPKLSVKILTRVGNAWYASDGAIATILAEELSDPEKYPEGGKVTVTINAYERNPKARRACIAHHGAKCAACGFDFQAIYGLRGEGFIHVHHITPIGSVGKEYEVDPISDLVPVCPNCHAMIHKKPQLSIKELRAILKCK